MVKVYYSYEHAKTVGQFVSRNCNFAIDHKRKLIFTGVNQYIAIISLKTGEVQQYLHKKDKNIPIRFLKISAKKIYAGYQDGEIGIWEADTYEFGCSLDLHKSTVSWISLSEDEATLVSGGLDGNIIIWDLLSEQSHQIKSAHSNAITQVQTCSVLYRGKPTSIIISIAKDGFLKIWNLQNQLCLSAISTHATQALSFHYSIEKSIIYVGTNKEDILMVRINEHQESASLGIAENVGVFKRKNYSKCQQMLAEYDRLYILNGQKKLQIYQILTEAKLKQRKKRALSRKKTKQIDEEHPQILAEEAINQYQMHFNLIEEKPLLFRAYSFVCQEGKLYFNNGANIIEFGSDKQITKAVDKTLQLEMAYPFLIQRNGINLQVYNYGNFAPLFSIAKKAQCCSLFSNGYLMIVETEIISVWDLAKNQCILELQQKWSGCWVKKNKCILWRENQAGLFEIGADSKGKTKMKQTSGKFFEDKVISAMYKHSFEKYIVNLQNSQIHIQFADTNKNFLKLYGHKMPVNSFDVSTDDALLASGSIDKDIRFWDMDFGHSIKTIFAHGEAVTSVKFIKDTHYLLSGSKDGHIKFWDGDTHQLILDLQENILQIKSIVISSNGDHIVAGGLDGGFRVWTKTNNQTIASDQQQKKLDKIMIEEYATQKFKGNEIKTRYEDLKHGQEIIQALDTNEQPNTLIKLLKKIPASNLKSSLSFLHSYHVSKLQKYLKYMIKAKYQQEVCWRVLDALGNGSTLGKQMRENWQDLDKILRINKQGLGLLLRCLKEEKQFTF